MRFSPDRDFITLSYLASGLSLLDTSLEADQDLHLPYNLPLTRGLNRLTLSAIEQKLEPPKSVWDFLDLANQPLKQWYLILPDELLRASLLENGYLTETCLELALDNPDVEAELTEWDIVGEALSTARDAGEPELYRAFRQFLIENPLIESFDLQRLAPELRRLKPVLSRAYEEVPTLHRHKGNYWRCETCGDLLQLVRDGWCCETHYVTPQRSPRGLPINTKDTVLRLKRGLRRYVFKPGLAELELATKLEKLNLRVELWPNYDAYDLRIQFADGEVWAVDVKDWANPYLLAKRISALPPTPKFDKAFFVFPDRRKTERYLSVFKRHSALAPRTTALFAKDFLRRVKKRHA